VGRSEGRLRAAIRLGILGLFVLGFAVILVVSMSDDEMSTGLGGKLLLGTGLAACVGGFVALTKPDRRS
jgi:hypothetical protein